MQATTTNKTFLNNYGNIFLMLGGVLAGCILGLVFGERVEVIKPIGDIFLNLLFTAVVPLVVLHNFLFHCKHRSVTKVW